jgi:arginine exporter protein ArgO
MTDQTSTRLFHAGAALASLLWTFALLCVVLA